MKRFCPVRALLLFSLVQLSACAAAGPASRLTTPEDALPEVPEVKGPLDIQVRYPAPGAIRPDVDSTFVFGSTGNGAARLTINGQPVTVAPNGAFLAYVRLPEDGVFNFRARRGRRTESTAFTYVPASAASEAVSTALLKTLDEASFDTPRTARIVAGKDTLATGSEIASAAPSPHGDRQWFFPIGTRVTVSGRSGNLYRIRLTGRTDGWLDTSFVDFEQDQRDEPHPIDSINLRQGPLAVDIVLPVGFAPFQIDPEVRQIGITIYGRSVQENPVSQSNSLIRSAQWISTSADSSRLLVDLEQPLWGFKAFYESDGDLVIRVRRPPSIDPDQPLHGLRILLDPGHPPGGAIGPTGLTEPEANLNISHRIAGMLRSRGANVLMTRSTPAPVVSATSSAQELWARVDTAVYLNADILISVHNNAFPDGVNPFDNFGTETYYYHPFSAPLAEALVREIAAVTGIPNLGAKQRSLALVRPTWFPSTLTESLFMMFPRQEAALRDPEFLNRVAAAHVTGIEQFLRRYLAALQE